MIIIIHIRYVGDNGENIGDAADIVKNMGENFWDVGNVRGYPQRKFLVTNENKNMCNRII